MLNVFDVLFYGFSCALILFAFVVIFAQSSVVAALFLVLCFFCTAVLWMIQKAEFLSLVLLFLYVGAVMTLFVFVVMMLKNFKIPRSRNSAWFFITSFIVASMFFVGVSLTILRLDFFENMMKTFAKSYNNVTELGTSLYSIHVLSLEVVGCILLSAMISVIVLGFFGRKADTKFQIVSKQVDMTKEKGMKLIKSAQVEEK